MFVNNFFKFIFIIFTITLLTGCSATRIVPVSSHKITTDKGITYSLIPYTSKINSIYHYGYDYANLSENTSFLLTVINNSHKPVQIASSLAAALINNLGNQYRIVQGPSLPSVKSKEEYHSSKLDSFWNTEEERLEEELDTIIKEDTELANDIKDLYLDYLDESGVTVNEKEELQKNLLVLRQELLELRKQNHREKIKKYTRKKIKQSYKKSKFKGGTLYPGAKISGLLVFSPLSDKTTSLKIMFPSQKNNPDKPLEFRFKVIRE